MGYLWDNFLEDYGNEIHDWTLRQLLEIFWEYCQDGNKAVAEYFKKRARRLSGSESYGENWAVLNLRVHKETGEYHAVGGDRVAGEGDMPYIGLELLESRLQSQNNRL